MFTEKCAIIGYDLEPGELINNPADVCEYKTSYVGRVIITYEAFLSLNILPEDDERRYIIAGIGKQRALNNEKPLRIDLAFLGGGYKNEKYPAYFDEKAYYFLKYIYSYGGKESREFEFNSTKDFSLAYASQEEFTRIMEYLEGEGQITIRKKHQLTSESYYLFMGVRLTRQGKDESEKSLPKIPMIGLVNQEITTGDAEIDKTINHAKRLFYEQPQSMDNMRSACESLSYVLEPLRSQCERIFGNPDTNAFFSIVNNFDIRHNKSSTKEIEFPEQLEWVFYSLLNTINTYTKLKTKNI